MGCDAYADEEGEFELYIYSYDHPNDATKRQLIKIHGMFPKEKINIDVLKGRKR